MSESPQPYRVLARKYRPQNFADLIGQEAMVKTLANAIARDRLAHAFLLTGVRGVGKTSTARLIAKALNCIGPDGQGGPTIDPCGVCEPCRAIAEGRHIDVVEMDAASHTSVENVREIIEAVRYAAVTARYKIYIVDEVHMLSKSAFNALLKTLEEPPEHVKFLFATTEVSKVPVTVLSRCQRFDLRRIPADRLAAHFGEVAKAEGAEIEGEALALIARAAEGSARDGLSILDQAIAHGGGVVTAEQVRAMLGLSDRGALRVLLGLLLAGDAPGALAQLKDQYDLGIEPSSLLRGLLDAVHGIARAKIGGGDDPADAEEERAAYADWAARLGHAAIHRLWQMLLKGLSEVQSAPAPFEAAEMALLRIIHAADLPDPGELAAKLARGEPVGPSGAGGAVAPSAGGSPGAAAGPAPPPAMPADFPSLVKMLEDKGRAHLAQQLHDYVGLVSYAPPALAVRPTKPLAASFARDLADALKGVTGAAWQVRLVEEEAQPTLRAQELSAEAAVRDSVLAAPVVKAAFAAFPDAELVGYDLEDRRSA